MAKVVILGAGVMGSAFAIPLADNGHQIALVGTHLDDEIIEQLHEDRTHPVLRTRLPETIQPYTYDRLEEAMADADLVVLGVNSLGVDWAAMMLGPLLAPETPVLFLTKGLEKSKDGLQILPQTFRDQLPEALQDKIQLTAVGGPSIAGELASRRHTSVVITGSDQPLLDRLAALIRTPYYHVWTQTDMVGIEVCVALKNVYALAVGIAAGQLEKESQADESPQNSAAMHNPAAAIFAQGLWEMAYFVEKMGGQTRTVIGMPGAGDLYVTCQGGRNSRMGRLLGLGMKYIDAKLDHMPHDTIEGAELAMAIGPAVVSMLYAGELDATAIPLLHTMINIVCSDQTAEIPWDKFFKSPATNHQQPITNP